MIIYDLECDAEHRFEGWFKNIADYKGQMASGILLCPICNSDKVRKLPTASYVSTGVSAPKNNLNESVEKQSLPSEAETIQNLHQLINEQFDNVGNKFAEEAKKIHYGEVEDRNICGTATVEEVTKLQDEGITAIPLPTPIDKDKLN